MLDLNSAWGIAAGVAGTLFVGFCLYFDHKRCNDPNYRKKVQQRRRSNGKKGAAAKHKSRKFNSIDHELIDRCFLEEVQLGETALARGEFERGVAHLANAIILSGQPAHLLQELRLSLPAQVFALLIVRLQEFEQRLDSDSMGDDEPIKTAMKNTNATE